MSNGPVVDVDAPDVDVAILKEPGALVKKAWSLGPIDPARALEEFKNAAELQAQMEPHAIARTKPKDWTLFGDNVYLQATGMERLTGLYGLMWGKYTVVREDYPDKTYAYIVEGPAAAARTGVAGWFDGGRWSGDDFFAKQHNLNPLDVRKASVTNWRLRAASMLMGLRGLTPADVECGVGGKVQQVDFKTGAQGGGVGRGEGGAVLTPYGTKAYPKGTPISECDEGYLTWLIKRHNEELADPKKAKWHKATAKRIEQYEMELDSRRRVRDEPEPPEVPAGS